jgi:hypothetical protein
MARKVFNFFISNKAENYPDPNRKGRTKSLDPMDLYKAAKILKFLLDRVCKSSSGFSHSEYNPTLPILGAAAAAEVVGTGQAWRAIQPHELLVYVLPTRPSSLLLREKPNRVAERVVGHGGSTLQLSCGMLSEVYYEYEDGPSEVAPWIGRVLAYIIFHEFMHNKLDAAAGSRIKDIHKDGGAGLAGARLGPESHPILKKRKLALEGLEPEEALTGPNIALRAEALPREQLQCALFGPFRNAST